MIQESTSINKSHDCLLLSPFNNLFEFLNSKFKCVIKPSQPKDYEIHYDGPYFNNGKVCDFI